jgi:copper chaperone CopZ
MMKKYKTNIKCDACIAKVTPSLNETAGSGQWHVDITDPRKVLTIEGPVDEAALKQSLEKVGYKAEPI